jgi:phosphohistidine phosphatase
MKTLLLVRHASSGSDDMSLSDRYRPLDASGERELARLAERCREQLSPPELIVSSPAVRALATARAMAEALRYRAADIRVDDRLYGGWGRGLLGVVAALDDALDHVAIVGHNPEIAEVARHLDPQIAHLPSGAVATLHFDATCWSEALHRRPVASAPLALPALQLAAGLRPLHSTQP